MVDTSIKNTGNSRSLRTVANALTLYPTHEAMIAAMVNGTFPIDIGPLNAAGLNTRGTDLNKASLLTDTLCTALGIATTATPTEAMEKLRQLIATAQSTAISCLSFSIASVGVAEVDMISGRRVVEHRGKVWKASYSYDYMGNGTMRAALNILRSGAPFVATVLPDNSDTPVTSTFLVESLTGPTMAFSRKDNAYWHNISFTLREERPH